MQFQKLSRCHIFNLAFGSKKNYFQENEGAPEILRTSISIVVSDIELETLYEESCAILFVCLLWYSHVLH